MVGIISTIVSLIVGVSYGAIAGYMGGRIDNLMMRIVDILYSIPYILDRHRSALGFRRTEHARMDSGDGE